MSVRSAIERVAPPTSPARAVLRVGRQILHDGKQYSERLGSLWSHARAPLPDPAIGISYEEWFDQHRIDASELVRQAGMSADLKIGVRVDFVLLPGKAAEVQRTLESLRGQTLRNWHAHVVGSEPKRGDERISGSADSTVDTVFSEVLAAGDPHDFVVVVEAGDRLEPNFVLEVAARAWADPGIGLIYWDDDMIGPRGAQVDPRFRPAWSPELLLSANYLGRSYAVRRDQLERCGRPKVERDDTGWWELLFRLSPSEDEVARIPRVLQHLVRRPDTTPAEAVEVVAAYLRQSGRAAQVSPTPTGAKVHWELDELPSVSVIIPSRHNREMLQPCLSSLAKTDYPRFEVIVVDNGPRTTDNEAWYANEFAGLDLRVRWWDRPFNYSAVNNEAVAEATGDVLIFLNDDTELNDPGWMREMVSWTRQPGVGLVGAQLIGLEGTIQHGGVVIGLGGFADHLFAGCAPGADTMIGSTLWYRNVLSATAACVAVERTNFLKVGGFDERFKLCGSDVVLGLDMRAQGLRNVITPFVDVRHLESATRGAHVEPDDYPTSYWRYQKWLRGGDPYYSPNLSLASTIPRLRPTDETDPMLLIGRHLRRDFTVFRQKADEDEARLLTQLCRADEHLREGVLRDHASHIGPTPVRTVNWFIPEIDSPFYGGINTAFRMADYLARHHDVENQFVVMAGENEPFLRSALAAAFPGLADSRIDFFAGKHGPELDRLPPADVSIATLWVTAYWLAQFRQSPRRFYLIQDFEPMFYPAGTNYALAEESYRLGLYGICNTERLLNIYESRYGGQGKSFMPAVQPDVFHADGRHELDHDRPAKIFLYSRPGHWRNCWEMASVALRQVKQRLGQQVHFVTAGSWARPDDLGQGIEHLGLLDYRDTGDLYRSCDAGIALTVSEHPSYLPLELMACGTPVVAFDNPAGDWLLRHDENCLRTPRTADGLADALFRMATDGALRQRLGKQGLVDIAARHADWDHAFGGIYPYLCDPEGDRRP